MSQALPDLALQVAKRLRDDPDCPRCAVVLADPEVGTVIRDIVDRIFDGWSENDAKCRKNSRQLESDPDMEYRTNHPIEVMIRAAEASRHGGVSTSVLMRMAGPATVKVSKRRANRRDVSEPERLPDMREGMSPKEWRNPTQRLIAFEYDEEATQFLRNAGLDTGRAARDRAAGIKRVKPEDVPKREQSSERTGRSVADGLSIDQVSNTYWDTTDGSWTGK